MEKLYYLLDKAAKAKRFSMEDKNAAKSLFKEMHNILVSGKNPPDFLLPSGQKATGATGRIAVNAYFLLLGRITYGKRFTRIDQRMYYWSMFLGYHIMRSNFGGWSKKGIYCCSTCTLSVFPLYCRDVFQDLDCTLLKSNVLYAYHNKERPFSGNYNKKYAEWSMQFA